MKESTTYQAILTEGEAKGERNAIFTIGEKRFGVPGKATRAKIEAIDSLTRLEELIARAMEVESWDELLR